MMQSSSRGQQLIQLTQVKTVVVSALPFLIGAAFASSYYHSLHLGKSLLILVAVILFHLAVNSHNQYTDFARYQEHGQVSPNNILQNFGIRPAWARGVIGLLVLASAGIGLGLVFATGWPLLLLGGLSFLVGYLYSGGPYPILKTPLGEPVSGLTMGYLIVMIGIYVNVYDHPAAVATMWGNGFLVALPAILTIANLMLANNIADQDEDLQNGRHTLVAFIGQRNGVRLWELCYALSYLAIIWAVAIHRLPWLTLLTLVTIIPVTKNCRKFAAKIDKRTTFLGAIFNVQLILITEFVTLVLGNWLP